ncbi:hypothetical protein FR932_18175 [Moritella marina ATCC 15381]|uniref:PhaC PHA synthase n=1 Tax=Moritella marina ATCC 15381 TaxID=1202962 RepID=A0A5J6WQD8_MORMI|nr:hypothetical protein [Moritella marina]QFI39604.1 hypothetical protein FR932_18175 [Moritella marina ATCC 15381]
MGFKKICLAMLATLSLSQAAIANELPAQFSTVGLNAPAGQDVDGFRLALFHGQTETVQGFDMAVLGLSEVDKLEGVSFNLLLGASKVNKEFSGASFSLFNWHLGRDTGFNMALVNNTHHVKGVNLAMVNLSKTVAGANIGLINYSDRLSLVDFGVMNYAKTAKFQIGIFNMTENLQGLQIGLLNYAENGVVKILPLINFQQSF